MHDYFEVTRTEYTLPKLKDMAKYCPPNLFIPTHGSDGIQYLYYIDFDHCRIVNWKVKVEKWITYLKNQYALQKILPHETIEKAIYGRLILHSATYQDGKVYVFPISGNYILCLSLDTDKYEVITDDMFRLICPTNNIVDGRIYCTRWDARDSVGRTASSQNIPLEFCYYDLHLGKFISIKTVNGPDSIHQTYYNPMNQSMLAIEMPRFYNMPFDRTNKSPAYLKDVLLAGIADSRILHYDIKADSLTEYVSDKSPAHITLDPTDRATLYITCCNLSGAYCFGAGRIDRYSYKKTLQILNHYEDENLFRIPSLEAFTYQGRKLLCAPVYPNQVHIFDASDLRCIQRVNLSENVDHPDFSSGPFTYPNFDKTPYTVIPKMDSPYLLLCSIWSVRILDIRSGEVVEKLLYNKNRAPLITTGHTTGISRT